MLPAWSRMRSLWLPALLPLLTLVLALAIARAAAAESRNPLLADLRAGIGTGPLLERARQAGRLRLIVGLDEPVAEESRLSAPAAAAQRRRLAAAQEALLRRLGAARDAVRLSTIPFLALEADPGTLQRLLADPAVASVQEDVPMPPLLRQSVPLIAADRVAQQGFSGAGQTVAVLDTGVDPAHPMLRGKLVSEACYSTRVAGHASSLCPAGAGSSTRSGSGKACPSTVPGCFHGTHVAGIALGSTAGIAGVARGARLISIQVFTRFDTAQGCAPERPPCLRSYVSDQLRAMERVYALRTAYRIAAVNLSLGGGLYPGPCDAQSPAMSAAIQKLRSVQIATVIAAGNDGQTGLLSAPGCISAAVTVGSTTKADEVSGFSNLAPEVDLLAPGSTITSALPGARYGIASGTSMATPHVAGAFAVLRAASPSAGIDQILAALQASPVLVGRDGISRPRLDLAAAVARLRAPAARVAASAGGALAGAGG